jgi:HlyD family secretion protein
MFAVLIRLENRGDLLKPGMNAEVQIQIASRDSVITVPTMALRVESDIPTAAVMLGLDEAALRAMVGSSAQPAGQGDRPPRGPPREGGAQTPRSGRETLPGNGGGRNDARGRPASAPSLIDYQFGALYWVVAVRGGEPSPVPVRTGLTDLEHSEIIAGLQPGEEVLLLPSSSLFEQQVMLQQFISDRFSSTPFQQAGGGGRGGRFR